MEFNDVIRKRTATRKFSNRKLSQEDIEKILEAGRLAPTAKNFQPQLIYVVISEEKIKKIGWNIQNIENIIPNTNVILIGSKKFINDKVFELKERQVENLEIIACYNYNEVKNDMKEIVSKYDGMLNTLGINKI